MLLRRLVISVAPLTQQTRPPSLPFFAVSRHIHLHEAATVQSLDLLERAAYQRFPSNFPRCLGGKDKDYWDAKTVLALKSSPPLSSLPPSVHLNLVLLACFFLFIFHVSSFFVRHWVMFGRWWLVLA